jgi:hypothetical protein
VPASTDAYDKLLARSPPPLAYIQYMRFCRRVLGVDRSRKVFSLARKAGADTHQVYTAMARIELFLNKEVKIAGKVYEAGMKKHANEPQFIQVRGPTTVFILKKRSICHNRLGTNMRKLTKSGGGGGRFFRRGLLNL